MNLFIEQLNNLSPYHFGFFAGSEYIVCVAPYLRTLAKGGDVAYIDGYYEISNSQYHSAKDFIAFCKAHDCVLEMEREKSYKNFLFESGFFQRGKNTLLIDSVFGSKIYFTIFKVIKPPTAGENRLEFVKFLQILKSKQSRFKTAQSECGSCNICLTACPQRAIPSNLGNCLRAHMQTGDIQESFSLALGNRVLGCEICSEVCPNNAGIAIQSQEQYTLLELLARVEKKDPELCAKYGKNIISKNKLLPYILNAMGNSGNVEYAAVLEKYTDSASDKTKNAALIALDKIKNSSDLQS